MYWNMVNIYSGDLPEDRYFIPVEEIDGFRKTYFHWVGCMVLHLLDSSILSPTEWPSGDLRKKKKKQKETVFLFNWNDTG